MEKKRKRERKRNRRRKARLLIESRCTHVVDYVTYPETGMRSHRHGKCSRWSRFSCGLCKRHCQQGCVSHSIMWAVVKEGRKVAGRGRG